ncbi:MAG: hypothetical protein M0Z46_10505 [Actinomycetota bacterium]|jgi:hypothetical protein|nr:hypothetical protein [Actinomycetota bacterium]
MLSKILEVLGTATDVRSLAAIVLGVLTTVVGHQSVIVTAVVDGVAGLIVLVDTFQIHKTQQAKVAASTTATARTVTTTAAPVTTTTTGA